jgi:hypothetical protein
MKLTEIQQAIQARISLIVGAENYDRLFLGSEFSEVEKGFLYCFAQFEISLPRSRTSSRCIFRLSQARLSACRWSLFRYCRPSCSIGIEICSATQI